MESETINKINGILEYHKKECNSFKVFEKEVNRILKGVIYFLNDVLKNKNLTLKEYYYLNKIEVL